MECCVHVSANGSRPRANQGGFLIPNTPTLMRQCGLDGDLAENVCNICVTIIRQRMTSPGGGGKASAWVPAVRTGDELDNNQGAAAAD